MPPRRSPSARPRTKTRQTTHRPSATLWPTAALPSTSAATIDDVQVTVTDDDAARVSIDPTELTVTEGDATGASYTVVLDSQPTADVTVTISGHAGTDVSVTPSSLTFTSESWGTAQTVTVSAAQDDDAAPDEAVTLSHAVNGTGEYAAIRRGASPASPSPLMRTTQPG